MIFDLFHTLTSARATRRGSADRSPSEVLGVDRARWNEQLVSRSRWRLAGDERDPFNIIRTLAHGIDPSIPLDRIREAVDVRRRRFHETLCDIPQDNLDALDTLRRSGLRLALLSNADVMEIEGWGESPLATRFDVEIFSCRVGMVKPEHSIYQRCLEALALGPGECWFVGDGGSNELAGAREIGLTTVFVSGVVAQCWPDQVPPRLAVCDLHVRRVPELLPLLGLVD
jgi:putative hydrolase of the HAD superfamily